MITLAMVALSGLDPHLASRARDAVFDSYQRAAPRPFDPNAPVHVIDIDEDALALYGQWPWPRTYLAVLTEKLLAHGASAVGFDIVFADPDRTAAQPPVPAQGLAPLAPPGLPSPDHDAQFATAIAAGPVVLSLSGAPGGSLPAPKAGIAFTGDAPNAALTGFPAAMSNRPVLEKAATGLGTISLGRSPDGIIRSVPLISDIGGQLMPGLAAELLRVAQGAGGYILRTTQASSEGAGGTVEAVALRVGGVTLPLQSDGSFRVYFSGHHPERLTPAGRVLQSDGIDPALQERISGRIVLVGASAQGLFDIRSTPLDDHIPGVTVHAEIIEQVAAGQYLQRPDWAIGAEVLATLLAGLAVSLVLAAQRPLLGLGAVVTLSGVSIGGSLGAFVHAGLLLNPIFPALTAIALYLPGATLGFLAKERARRAVRARFAYFLPPQLVAEIADDPDTALTPDGAERELTVMFVDLRGFTSITENMPPKEVVQLVNRFLATVSDTIVSAGGTIDKFMGDAVMAFWNAPIADPDHRRHALQAIPAIEQALAAMNQDLAPHGQPPLDIGIGVNTGTCAVGLMGSRDRLSYTCVGDNVTLASRLEGLTRLYGTGNCLGPDTVTDLPQGLWAAELDRIAVKGRREPLTVYTLVPEDADSATRVRDLAEARDAFLGRDWDRAEALFQDLAAQSWHGRPMAPIAQLYRDRVADLRAAPPSTDWDGSATASSKR